MFDFFDRVEDKIEVLFTFLNKEPKDTAENTKQVLIAVTMFIAVFASMAFTSTNFWGL